jgi:hypothetical protein
MAQIQCVYGHRFQAENNRILAEYGCLSAVLFDQEIDIHLNRWQGLARNRVLPEV